MYIKFKEAIYVDSQTYMSVNLNSSENKDVKASLHLDKGYVIITNKTSTIVPFSNILYIKDYKEPVEQKQVKPTKEPKEPKQV